MKWSVCCCNVTGMLLEFTVQIQLSEAFHDGGILGLIVLLVGP